MKRPSLKNIRQGFKKKTQAQTPSPEITAPAPASKPELEIDPGAEMDAVLTMTSIAGKWAETTELELTDRGKIASKAVELVFTEDLSAEEAWLTELTHWIAALKVRDEKLLYIECLRFFIRHCHRELGLSSEFVGSINGAAADMMRPPAPKTPAAQFSYQPPVAAPPPTQPPPQSAVNPQTPADTADKSEQAQSPYRNLATLLIFTGVLFPVFFVVMALMGNDPGSYRITQFSSEQWSVNPDNRSEAVAKSFDHTALAAVRFDTDSDCSPSQFFISEPGIGSLIASLLSGKRQSYLYQVDSQGSHTIRSTRLTDWRSGQIFDLGAVQAEDIERITGGSDLFYSRALSEPRTRFTLAGSSDAIDQARQYCQARASGAADAAS